MLVKVKENKKVYNVSLQAWDESENQWQPDISDEVLVDMWWLNHKTEEFTEGYTLTQKEFDEFQEQLKQDVETYNKGGYIEWFTRPSDLGEDEKYDIKELKVDIEFDYIDED